MDTLEAIRSRRSVKPEHMRSDPVPDPVIQELLEAANWAPSHGHTEPWRFVGFRGETRAALVDAMCEAKLPPGQPAWSAVDPRRERIRRKVMTAPLCLAIVCAVSTLPKIQEHEELASTAMAVQNLHLAARARGLGGFWSSGKKAAAPSMARFLKLAPNERCLGFFYLGYPAVEWPTSLRGPVGEKVRWYG
ncbi:MAG: nitroreductase [Myxococcota bacterium]